MLVIRSQNMFFQIILPGANVALKYIKPEGGVQSAFHVNIALPQKWIFLIHIRDLIIDNEQ